MKDLIRLVKDITIMVVFGIVLAVVGLFALISYMFLWVVHKVSPVKKTRRVSMEECGIQYDTPMCPRCEIYLVPLKFSSITEHECPQCGYMSQELPHEEENERQTSS